MGITHLEVEQSPMRYVFLSMKYNDMYVHNNIFLHRAEIMSTAFKFECLSLGKQKINN